MSVVGLRPGDRLIVVAVDPNLKPTHPIVLPPAAPGVPAHPIVLPGDPEWPGLPVDPGYGIDEGTGVPPKPTHPIALPGDGFWGSDLHPTHPIVEPPTEPPPVTPPTDGGRYVWAWSPQLGRWVWVQVPGAGEAGPKKK